MGKKQKRDTPVHMAADMRREGYYLVHDNGGRPWCVHVNDAETQVTVYTEVPSHAEPDGGPAFYDDERKIHTHHYFRRPTAQFDVSQVFVGKSPLNHMTAQSQAHGSEFDGNTILFQRADTGQYVYIERIIVAFDALAPIVHYVSPVGNSDVPYAYAVDAQNRRYLMCVSVILNHVPADMQDDPSDYYFHGPSNLTMDYPMGAPIPGYVPPFDDFWVGRQPYFMHYQPRPRERYQRLLRMDDDPDDGDERHAEEEGGPIRVYATRHGSNERKELTEDDYVRIMEQHAEQYGLVPMHQVMIYGH